MKKCIYCGNVIKKNAKYFCSYYCDQEYRYLIYINKWKIGVENGIKGKNYVSGYIRKYLFRKYNNKCQLCGWGEVNKFTNKVPLEIHHIDGNCFNNRENNLQLLCPNCHSLTNNFRAKNKKGLRER